MTFNLKEQANFAFSSTSLLLLFFYFSSSSLFEFVRFFFELCFLYFFMFVPFQRFFLGPNRVSVPPSMNAPGSA